MNIHTALLTNELAERIADEFIASLKFDELDEAKKQHWYDYIKAVNPWEGKFRAKLVSLFDEQEKEVLANMKKHPKAKPDDIDLWMFGKATWQKRFSDDGGNFIKGITLYNGMRTMADLPVIGVEFNVENPAVVELLKKRTKKFSAEVVGTTETEIRSALAEGIQAGEGMPALRKRVQGVFANATKNRSAVIARSETIWASNTGAEQAYIMSEVVSAKVWLTAIDERACDWCVSMNGKKIGLGKNYFDKDDSLTVNGSSMSFGYDDIKNPPLHPQCRCTIVPEIVE